MPHRITFAREQRIHVHAGLGGHLLEAAPFQLVGNKHLALLLGQLFDRQLELIEKHAARVSASGEASTEGSRSSKRSSSPSSSSCATATSLKFSGLFLRNRSMMRFRATRNSQPVTCSMGMSKRLASTSS